MPAGRARPSRPAAPTLALAAGIAYAIVEILRQSAVPSPPGVPGDSGVSVPVILALGIVVATAPTLLASAVVRARKWWAELPALALGIWPFAAAGLWWTSDRTDTTIEVLPATAWDLALPGLGLAVVAALVALPIAVRWPPKARLPRRAVLLVVLAGLVVLGLRLRAPAPAVDGDRRGGPNVLLVSIDTLRRDALGRYGGSWATALDSVGGTAHEGWSVCSWTLPSMASLFSGTVPTGSGADADHFADPAVAWWPETLAQSGWQTAAFVTNPYLRRRFGFGRGFQSYDHAEERPWLEPVARTLLAEFVQAWLAGRPDFDRADTIAARAMRWLDRAPADRPWLLWVHLLDPHVPYVLRGDEGLPRAASTPEWISPLAGEYEGVGFWDFRAVREGVLASTEPERAALRRLYQTEVDFSAWWTRSILESARRASGDRELIWLVTSDHGEEFFEEGGFEHGHSLGDPVLRVPLLAEGLGEEPRVLRLIDVGPGILARIENGPAFDPSRGTRLLDADSGLSEYALGRVSPFAPCERPQMMAEGLLYGDPRTRFTLPDGSVVERQDFSGALSHPAGCAGPGPVGTAPHAPWQELDLWRERRGVSPGAIGADEDVLRSLRALGYIR